MTEGRDGIMGSLNGVLKVLLLIGMMDCRRYIRFGFSFSTIPMSYGGRTWEEWTMGSRNGFLVVEVLMGMMVWGGYQDSLWEGG